MMQDWPRPRANRASNSAGKCNDGDVPWTNEVRPVTADQRNRLMCITNVPPILSATTPRGICMGHSHKNPCTMSQVTVTRRQSLYHGFFFRDMGCMCFLNAPKVLPSGSPVQGCSLPTQRFGESPFVGDSVPTRAARALPGQKRSLCVQTPPPWHQQRRSQSSSTAAAQRGL